MPIYRAWNKAITEWNHYAEMPGNENLDWPEAKAAEARENAAFSAMIDMSPVSMEGIAAIAHLLWETEGLDVIPTNEEYSAHCDSAGNRLIRAIWRAASGKEGLPRAP